MSEFTERRREARLRYNWPIWFAEDFSDKLIQGQFVDLNSGGAAFTCYADQCPQAGQHITTRFSVPEYNSDDSFHMSNFVRSGNICRIEQVNPFLRKIAIQFVNQLPFKPGEQPNIPSLDSVSSENAIA